MNVKISRMRIFLSTKRNISGTIFMLFACFSMFVNDYGACIFYVLPSIDTYFFVRSGKVEMHGFLWLSPILCATLRGEKVRWNAFIEASSKLQ